MAIISGLCAPSSTESPLESRLIEHEGVRKFVYLDSRGFSTIAIGRNIDPRSGHGLSAHECVFLLRNDIASAREQVESFPWYRNQDTVRKDVLVELAFNMGISGLLKFKQMLQAMGERDYVVAASELKQSLWATQVSPARCADLMHRIRFGEYR